MEPKWCLLSAESCIQDGKSALARDCLNEYAEWRNKGNSQPMGGDVVHMYLVALYNATFSEPYDGATPHDEVDKP
jgi:hypothetical protein